MIILGRLYKGPPFGSRPRKLLDSYKYKGVGNLKERDHLGDTDVDGRIILRWIFRKWNVGVWIGSTWLRIRTLVNAVINFQIP